MEISKFFSVEVNNTHNVSYGGSNNVNNVAYSKYSTAGGPTAPATSSSTKETTATKVYATAGPRDKDQDVVVLLPQRKNRAPRLKHKLSVSLHSRDNNVRGKRKKNEIHFSFFHQYSRAKSLFVTTTCGHEVRFCDNSR